MKAIAGTDSSWSSGYSSMSMPLNCGCAVSSCFWLSRSSTSCEKTTCTFWGVGLIRSSEVASIVSSRSTVRISSLCSSG